MFTSTSVKWKCGSLYLEQVGCQMAVSRWRTHDLSRLVGRILFGRSHNVCRQDTEMTRSARTRCSVGRVRRVFTQPGRTAYIRPWQRRQTIMFLPSKRISDHFPGAGRSAATAAPWESKLEGAAINLELQRSLPARMRWSVFCSISRKKNGADARCFCLLLGLARTYSRP